MSWDAELLYPGPPDAVVIDVNYTHNTNRMISAALEAIEGTPVPDCPGPLGPCIGPMWWDRLDGATGADGAAYLSTILTGLRANPAKYEAMNPPNGWGDYRSLVSRLAEMQEASIAHPAATWRTSG